MTKPTFLIIGAKKSGTTSLHQYLGEHPRIFMSRVKEPNFFAYAGGRPVSGYPPGLPIPIVEAKSREDARKLIENNVNVATFTTQEAYETLFEDADNCLAIGEASHTSLYFPQAAEHIFSYIPEARLVVILRNPVDRAYSDYLGMQRMGREPIANFLEAFKVEDLRISLNYDSAWHYKSHGYYYLQLMRYYRLFPESQIKIILNEDIRYKPEETVKSLYQFLGVDDSFRPALEQSHNIGGVPHSRFQKMLFARASRPSKLKTLLLKLIPTTAYNFIWRSLLTKPKLHDETRAWITKVYEPDILKLQDLIQRDLSKWLNSTK